MLNRFLKDRYFLSRYYIFCTILFLILNYGLFILKAEFFSPSVGIWIACLLPLIISNFMSVCIINIVTITLCAQYFGPISFKHFLLTIGGIYFGMLHTALIHNCAHNNFKPRFLNRILGEILSLHMMSGYPGFVIIHLQHHKHADNSELDPHPNDNLTYWQYLNGLKKNLKKSFLRLYTETWGNDEESLKIWAWVRYLLPLNRILRAFLILLLFGPVGFSFFYIPSYISSQLTYAHVNYYTHARQEDNSVKIINMNHNIIYKVLNKVLIGIYFHKNHHDKPRAFNPQNIKG